MEYTMLETGHIVQQSVTVEEQPQQAPPVVTMETSEDGTSRRTETTVKKVVKTVTTRTAVPSAGDTRSVDGTVERVYTQPGRDYHTATVPRNYQYGPSPEVYARLGPRYRPVDGYRTLDVAYRSANRLQVDPYAAQPQVRSGSAADLLTLQRFVPEPYGLEDDQRSIGYDEPDYGMAPPILYGSAHRLGHDLRRRVGSYEVLDGDMSVTGDMYYWGVGAPLAQGERGSLASLDSLRKAAPTTWRQPELAEVIAMLTYRLDPVRSNAAAYLQHLTYRNDKVKSDVRRLKGIPALVSMLDSPCRDVHYAACGALKNISFGRDADNKIAVKNCDGVPALVRLLRKTHEQNLTDTITATLWNLSSHDAVRMEMVDHALHALSDEVLVPRSGWERGADENCKPKHMEWETSLNNTTGCLRNVSSERSEARRKLRECTGLVDALMYIVQSLIDRKDMDNKLMENSVCVLRNLSYQVHREVPGHERYQEMSSDSPSAASSHTHTHKASCFGSRKDKAHKDADTELEDIIDLPKRATAAKGYELLFQPEVVRIYTTLMTESKNAAVLEASAGALQNLCAGHWSYGRYIRAVVRQDKALSIVTELLQHNSERVVTAASATIRNLSIDPRNKHLLGKHAVPCLVSSLPCGVQQQAVRTLSEDTRVSILGTLAELVRSNVDAAKTLRTCQGIERLVLVNKDSNRSEREVRGAGQVLQIVWGFKELKRSLEKDGWKKSDFTVTASVTPAAPREDSTLPLLEKGNQRDREVDMIPMNELQPEAFSPLDLRERRGTMNNSGTLDICAAQDETLEDRRDSEMLLASYNG